MIIGKFQQEDGVYIGTVAGFGGTAPVRIAKTDLKGIDYTVTFAGSGPRSRRRLEKEKRQRERLSVDQARQSVPSQRQSIARW